MTGGAARGAAERTCVMKLILEGIEKHFGEKQVLKGASFTFESGAEALQIAREYAGEAPADMRGGVTRGLYFRKVL